METKDKLYLALIEDGCIWGGISPSSKKQSFLIVPGGCLAKVTETLKSYRKDDDYDTETYNGHLSGIWI